MWTWALLWVLGVLWVEVVLGASGWLAAMTA